MLPFLEAVVEGIGIGEMKAVWVTKAEGFAVLNDDFYFDIVVDDIRVPTDEELKLKRPLKNTEIEGMTAIIINEIFFNPGSFCSGANHPLMF